MWYLDTSAAVKLVAAEENSADMVSWFDIHEGLATSSDLLRTELLRAVRGGRPDALTRARAVLDSIALTTIPTDCFERAAEIDPAELRFLDAIHLAAARRLGDDLDGIVTYDGRLGDVARFHGIAVVSPGLDN